MGKVCDICGGMFHSKDTLLSGEVLNLCCKHKHQVRRFGKILKRTAFDKNEIRKKGGHWEIDLYNKDQEIVGMALFDQRDKLEEVKKYKWCLVKKGKYGFYTKTDTRVDGKRKTLYLHDLLIGEKNGLQVDHIDGITLDNRQQNLRLVTQQQNLMNKTRAKGYSWNKGYNRWEAYIGVKNKRIKLGYFKTEEEAQNARKEAVSKYYEWFR